MKNIFYMFIIVLIIFFIIGCTEDSVELDYEVHIEKVYKSTFRGGSANVRYFIENIGNQNIRGWNIYFRVSMESGHQVTAFQGRTYYLNPHESSEELTAIGIIPEYYKKVDEPISAILQFIEVY